MSHATQVQIDRARVLRGALQLRPLPHVAKVFRDFTPRGLEQLRRVLRAGVEKAKRGTP